jgi:hypothetical protein
MSKDWKNNEQLFAKQKSCKHCLTSSAVKKMKDVFSRTANKLRDVWLQYRKNKNS